MRRGVLAVGLAATLVACSKAPADPIQLDRNILTVDNRTGQEWSHVEVWLNTYYRVSPGTIPPDGRFQVPLDAFVAGFGQRFDFKRAQIKDLRLTAKLPNGQTLELKKELQSHGLGQAFGGKR